MNIHEYYIIERCVEEMVRIYGIEVILRLAGMNNVVIRCFFENEYVLFWS